jgi:antagonist of KipI
MSILIQKPGILSTVQDLGRTGLRYLGINPGGAMDTTAARLINILLGNEEGEGVIEMHFPAAEIKFETDVLFSLGGADFSAHLDGRPVENWRPVFAPKGSILSFPQRLSGARAYFSIKGGFKLEKWLGSISTNLAAGAGGFEGRKLEKGDRILLNDRGAAEISSNRVRVSPSMIPRYGRFPTVRVTTGAEFDLLNALSQETFLNHDFVVSPDSDRMGYRLRGKPIHLMDEFELVSSAACFGTIQLLPDGQLIVLMADHQTTGGYPRIAHVATVDLPLLAQIGANDKAAFHLITVAEAEDLAFRFERDLNYFRTGLSFRNA